MIPAPHGPEQLQYSLFELRLLSLFGALSNLAGENLQEMITASEDPDDRSWLELRLLQLDGIHISSAD